MASEQPDRRRLTGRALSRGVRVAPTLAGLGIFSALLMSAIALARSGESTGTTIVRAPAAAILQRSAAAAAPSAAPARVLDVTINPESKLGPDDKRHDAFSTTEFAVKIAQPLTLRIDNTDTQPHSITSPLAGVNIVVLPGTHSYTLIVRRAGRFPWRCIMVCDTGAAGWAMTHRGYMSGYITAS